jgi:hypothetical protein
MDPSRRAQFCPVHPHYSHYSYYAEPLDSFMSWNPQMGSYSSRWNQDTDLSKDWEAFINSQPWEFKLDFWSRLAEHPLLLGR